MKMNHEYKQIDTLLHSWWSDKTLKEKLQLTAILNARFGDISLDRVMNFFHECIEQLQGVKYLDADTNMQQFYKTEIGENLLFRSSYIEEFGFPPCLLLDAAIANVNKKICCDEDWQAGMVFADIILQQFYENIYKNMPENNKKFDDTYQEELVEKLLSLQQDTKTSEEELFEEIVKQSGMSQQAFEAQYFQLFFQIYYLHKHNLLEKVLNRMLIKECTGQYGRS